MEAPQESTQRRPRRGGWVYFDVVFHVSVRRLANAPPGACRTKLPATPSYIHLILITGSPSSRSA